MKTFYKLFIVLTMFTIGMVANYFYIKESHPAIFIPCWIIAATIIFIPAIQFWMKSVDETFKEKEKE